jgi:hypothetical protein
MAQRECGGAEFGEEGASGSHGLPPIPIWFWRREDRAPNRLMRRPSSAELASLSISSPIHRVPAKRDYLATKEVRAEVSLGYNKVEEVNKGSLKFSLYGLLELFELYFVGGGGHPSKRSPLFIVFFVGLSGLGNDVGKRSLALRRIRRSISHLSKPVNSWRPMSSRITSRTLGTKGGRPIGRSPEGDGSVGAVSSVISRSTGMTVRLTLLTGWAAVHPPIPTPLGLAPDLQSVAPSAPRLEVLAALGL